MRWKAREHLHWIYMKQSLSFRIAEHLVWFTARENLGDTHTWWENDASFRKFSCSATFISLPTASRRYFPLSMQVLHFVIEI